VSEPTPPSGSAIPAGVAPDPSRSGPGSRHRLEVDVHPTRRDTVGAHLWALGATGLEERPTTLLAWFEAGAAGDHPTLDEDLAARVPELAPAARRWSVEPDRDWQSEWKATIAPVRAGRIVVVPSWLAPTHEPGDDELTLVLDPGRAFGSGHHATTLLCLELLDELDEELSLTGRTLADVGCGTGVLAIAAAARGAVVTAVDVDPTAVAVTRENAERNGVELHTSTGSVEAVAEPAEVVVANLVTDVIVSLAADLVAATRSVLIVSGIATVRRDRALAALTRAGAGVVEVRERDGWLAARLTVTTSGEAAS
jgi:ribosomal protein L11 methyltransferase